MHKIYLQQLLSCMTIVVVKDMYNQWYDVRQVDQDFLDVVVLDNVPVLVDEYADFVFHNSNHNNVDML